MKSRRKSRKRSLGKCRKYLGKKIGINIAEYNRGRWVSREQAIAVAYSEVLNKFPHCKQHLKKKSGKRSRRCKNQ